MSTKPTIEPVKLTDRELFSILWQYVKRHYKLFSIVIFTLLLNVGLATAGPLFFNYVLEKIEVGATQSDFASIRLAMYAYFAFSLLSWVFAAIQFMFVAKLNARVIRDIRIDAFNEVLNNKVSFYDKQESGDLTSRIINDTKELSESARDIAWVLTSIVRLVLVISVFVYFSLTIALAALSFLPIIMFIAILLGKYERRVSKTWRTRFGEVNARFSETMSKIQISKAFNRETENLDRFKTLNEATYKASIKRGFAIFVFWPITDILKHLLLLIILAVGTWEVQRGMPIATLVLFLILINYFYWPLITIANNYHKFQGAFANIERIAKVSRDPNIKELNVSGNGDTEINGNIQFTNLTFSYQPDEVVLKNVTFNISAGERIAIVGQTGAGKSTIASLLMRFYPINSGMILLDGKTLEEYDLFYFRKNISLVSQRVLLFKGTIRENLLVADPQADDNRLWDILDRVQSREFIENLPNGLDTEVEENGRNLSAGQRQMISFARAILSDPKVIILDEATSAVDLYTESKIQDAIDVILENRTSISIAHRLTTILKSDKIIVLDNGQIVQMGTHDELLEEEGLYNDMYNLYLETQSAKYLEKIKT